MELEIIDVTFLPDGKAHLEYITEGPPKLLEAGCFELIINGISKKHIWVDGGVLFNRRNHKKPYPSTITTSDLTLKKYSFERKKWKLVSVPKNKCLEIE